MHGPRSTSETEPILNKTETFSELWQLSHIDDGNKQMNTYINSNAKFNI